MINAVALTLRLTCAKWLGRLTVLIVLTAGITASAQEVVQVFYIPLPEDDLHHGLETIDDFRGNIGSVLRSTVSIVPSLDNTVIYYDHWEDGYEGDSQNPTQTTTEVFGDGQTLNGYPPGNTSDVIQAGDIISLENDVTVPRNSDIILYDGRDKVAISRPVSISRAVYALDPGEVLAGASQIYATEALGYYYRSPVGTDISTNQMFEYASLFIMSSFDGTRLTLDTDADGSIDQEVLLDEGEAYRADFVVAGAAVQASKPVQVHLITGDIQSNYEMRWYTLHPEYMWDSDYYTPVGSDNNSVSEIYIYNPQTNSLNAHYETAVSTGSIAVAGGEVGILTMPVDSGGRFFTTNGMHILPIQIMDGAEEAGGNEAYDWGHDILPRRSLTKVALVGWGPGSSDPDLNGNPIWVTAESNTTVYIDLDGDPTTGPLVDANGNQYDFQTNISRLSLAKIYDINDNDQTGMRLYTLDGTGIASAWGQDPSTAGTGNPYLDMGAALLPFPTVLPNKYYSLYTDVTSNGLVDPGDTIMFTVVVTRVGFEDSADVIVLDPGTTNANYNAGSTRLNGVAVPDDTNPPPGTAFPLDEGGLNIGSLDVGQTSVITFTATVLDPFPAGEDQVVNSVLVESREATVSVPVPKYGLTIDKTNVPSSALDPGDSVLYKVYVFNTGTVTETGLRVEDPEPFGLTYVSNSTKVIYYGAFSNRLADSFQRQSFSGSDGGVEWLGDWVEIGESDGPESGYLTVEGDSGFSTNGFVLRLSASGRGAYRLADLSSYATALLSFDVRRDALEYDTEYAAVYASGNGGVSWTELDRFEGPADDSSYVNMQYDLSSYLSTNSAIRFLNSGAMSSADAVLFDHIRIAVSGNNVTNQGGAPSTVVSGYSIQPGDWIEIQMTFTVDDPAVITKAVNQASVVSRQSSSPRSASVTNLINTSAGMTITKTSSTNGTVDPGDTLTYEITIENTGTIGQTQVTLEDVWPANLDYVAGSAVSYWTPGLQQSVEDTFTTVSFANQDGSLDWLFDWQESESDGPAAGNVFVQGGELVIDDASSAYRAADLSSFTTASWYSVFREAGSLESSDIVHFEVSTNGSSWIELGSVIDDFGGPVATNYDLTPYISSNTYIRYRLEFFGASDEYFFLSETRISGVVTQKPALAPDILLYQEALAGGQKVVVKIDAVVGVADQIVNQACVRSYLLDELCASVTNGIDIVHMTQGVVTAWSGPGAISLSWTATTNQEGQVVKDYDLLYCDQRDFMDQLSNSWQQIAHVTNSYATDTGQVTGIGPRELGGKLRFYRVAREGAWKTSETTRIASEEIFVLQAHTLYPGQNWIGLGAFPMTNTIRGIFGVGLPASITIPEAAKISWYLQDDVEVVTNEVFLQDFGESNRWTYSHPPESPRFGTSADSGQVPIGQGCIINIPGTSTVVWTYAGWLPTNTLSQSLKGRSYNIVSAGLPRQLHPDQMNLRKSGFGGIGWNPALADWIFKYDGASQTVPDALIFYDALNGFWRHGSQLNGYPPVKTNYFKPGEGIMLLTWYTEPTIIWTNKLLYSLPTKTMTP